MFGTLGGPELFLILVVALIVFGPRKLPEIGKSLGRMMGEFRKASQDFQRTIEEEVEADKLREATRLEPPAAWSPPASAATTGPPAGAGTAPAETNAAPVVGAVEPTTHAKTVSPEAEPDAGPPAEQPASTVSREASSIEHK
jgi:sec-independent protein translocase protein TatB